MQFSKWQILWTCGIDNNTYFPRNITFLHVTKLVLGVKLDMHLLPASQPVLNILQKIPSVYVMSMAEPYRRFTAHCLHNPPKCEFQESSYTIPYSLFLQLKSTNFLCCSYPCLSSWNLPATLVYVNWYAPKKKGGVHVWPSEPVPDLIWNLFLPIRIPLPFFPINLHSL